MIEDQKHKSKLISSGLLEYYFHIGGNNIHLDIKFVDNKLIFNCSGEVPKEPDDLEHINELINLPRYDDVELYYAELLDLSDGDSSMFNLLSDLIDSGSAVYKDGVLSFNLERIYI
ncbi:hypothetical protein [Peptoniphilus indolicus]|uniref:Uncharacterized protein n=2 Tax=Peptoniphilus indolicus TaxID=33030 RepID=A0A379DD73_9FIRM|nr:hypothetical protein [Peptoniphilus indolicus]SUB75522.1 Uncharacterised protein [Peptoniphilus indolicus]